ncbi:glycosyltransferase family 2 protein [Maritimibacter sp. UBA3975]|uniref:glycosyltransferase family 2 protein n=1 Tax=Maritimibacter sp. UBA3975 TaxID=1946833 RepID=UPI0025B8E08A|nr:glycosyltransferase family 2 protein [Maritimibacter sp. UBA3975]
MPDGIQRSHAYRPVADRFLPAAAARAEIAAPRRDVRPHTPARPSLAVVPSAPPPRPGLGALLVATGDLRADDLAEARAARRGTTLRLGDVLLSRGLLTAPALFRGLARLYGTTLADLDSDPPDVRLIDEAGLDLCFANRCVPWKRVGDTTIIACAYPDRFARIAPQLPAHFGRLRMVVASGAQVEAALIGLRHRHLVQRAETRVQGDMACRTWNATGTARLWLILAGLLALVFLTSPLTGWAMLTGWAVATLAVNSAVKLAAIVLHTRAKRTPAPEVPAPGPHDPRRRPVVTILVPLYREREIAGRLVKRLERLTYPRELLDICLIVEEDDTLTHATLAAARLPAWMRQVTVPRGGVRTKPRALNFALDFARGSVIGVYDAEDAPAPDQIDRIVARFSLAPPRVACLQGVLDYYNARTNWLSRCFTIEYATWFRLMLPGMAKLGFAVPLGGTTLFFRRAALEHLGGWDAHNVTEDADLGMRLARLGYTTELVNTVTQEEANCRLWPWIKQRSRWIKGYAMTYGVHMRAPMRLWRELGPRGFAGFQIVFLGTLSHLLLAPVLWSYWAFALGIGHPLAAAMPVWMIWTMFATFVLSEAVSIAAGMIAVSTPGRRFLRPWVVTLHVYFPLASLAALKGSGEIVRHPFYWDKTQHGHDDHDEAAQAAPIIPVASRA